MASSEKMIKKSSEGMRVKNDFVPFYLPILSSRGLRPSFLLGWNELLFLLCVHMGGGGTCTVPTSEMSTIVGGGVGTVNRGLLLTPHPR